MPPLPEQRTLLDLLPTRESGIGIRFIAGAQRERIVTYYELVTIAGRILAALRARGLRPGDEVVIAVGDPEDFVPAFWACLMGRLVAVPVQPPASADHRTKLRRILHLLQRPFLIGEAEADIVHYATPAELLAEGHAPAPPEAAKAEDIAFVQFSSGSTGEPKGVELQHGRIVQHLFDFAASARMTQSDSFLSWFPLSHDMGLIGWHLIPLAIGAPQALMPTRLFVQRPSLWLAKASQHRASVLTTNNFGLKHFLKLLRQDAMAGWELDCIRLLFNAAEPISAELCVEFQDKMAHLGRHPLGRRYSRRGRSGGAWPADARGRDPGDRA